MTQKFIPCVLKRLPAKDALKAAREAGRINPANLPPGVWPPENLAAVTQKYWGAKGVKLTVGFMETIQPDLRDRILSHFSVWGAYCNVSFAWTQTAAQVRVSRGRGGYWSYLGPDILHIPASKPTMNLEAFTMSTPESEFHRVIRHEVGHTLGFPHEHLRKELVDLLDPDKTVAYFMRTQGWSEADVRAQVLTPVSESSLMGTEHADAQSIMCYTIPSECTISGQPIVGGTDIDAADQAFAAKLYPKPDIATPPPPNRMRRVTLEIDGVVSAVRIVDGG